MTVVLARFLPKRRRVWSYREERSILLLQGEGEEKGVSTIRRKDLCACIIFLRGNDRAGLYTQ